MEQLLLFNGLQIGDQLLRSEPFTTAMSRPVIRVGIFHETAAINVDSRNLLHGRRFFVVIARPDNLALDQVISQIQELQSLRGEIKITDGGATKMLCLDWVIENVDSPNLRPEFGGRFTDQLAITAIGETAPQYL